MNLTSLSSLDFYHFDFYRFADPRELDARRLSRHVRAPAACA
ncbi:MAG: tRNA (adenosine(37)-N6)-threonylcarbamoyltransferase complex ATPase subunit type 1 TsaE [Comamonadaceae bacterium]|nr:tRNA (adenosine(37)-N6)-threonylcarbamoyltransferase complex ATPase subunit type 1 TsaE [Comamonadaceae bacterium]